ncbi:AAA family ATPase [Deinococcus altitudinis]|uniref:AAA family ATPase n=1 Tax=Deinococcus altitudinis TaxID=468914 RepID=UPI0038927766
MISSLTLQGFKSFADRTRLEFGPGITAVIGPNGSGKSNVVEALRWVSHQARARELRAARATELIFHGSAGEPRVGGAGAEQPAASKISAGKAPLGLAEVQVELRTFAGERLHLARRIYRDGAAEQDIMGRSVRARDVQGALRGTGLGSGGLAVIGQGEVGSVIQAEGPTLLAYVQEAAGLSRSVAARQDTETGLHAAETQLAQVRLLEAELESRVRRLHLAAAAAERFRMLSLQRFQLQDALVRARHLSALDDLLTLRGRVRELTLETQTLGGRVVQAAAELELARVRVAQAREQSQAHTQTLELLRAATRSEQQAGAALAHLERDLADTGREQERLNLAPPSLPEPALTDLQAALTAARTELVASVKQARDLETQLRRAREQSGREAQQRAALGAQQGTLQTELDRLSAQIAEETEALDRGRREAQQLSDLAAATAATHADVLTRHAALLERERESRAALQSVQAQLPPLRREEERLEAALNGYARYGEGPRTALRSDHPGIVGSVADLLTVPAEHETAVGAALGRRLEQVVVQSADDAREIIDLLKRSGGRATFLPLDLLRPRQRRDGSLLHEPGVLGNLSDLCPSAPPIVGQNLLSDTLLMSSLQSATALARRHASRPRLVTVEGELLEPGGALTGGRSRDSGAGVLSDQRRFAELQDELSAMQRRQVQLKAGLDTLSGDTEDSAISESVARAAQRQSRQRAQEAALHLAGLEARVASLQGQQQALLTRLRTSAETSVQSAERSLPDSVQQDRPDPARLEALLEQTRAAGDAAAQQEQALNTELAAARELQAVWTAHRAALLRQDELRSRRDMLGERLQALLPQLSQLAAETARHQAALGGFDPGHLTETEARRDALSLEYSGLISRQNRAAALLEETRLTQARREGTLQDIPDGNLLPGQPRDWQTAVGKVAQELELIGTVNPAASEELASEQERLDLLSRDREDVQQAVDALREHLSEISDAEQQATGEALVRVGQAFADYSGELLGGTGELELERDSEGRLLGLRLAVQPKGKRTRNLNLLSAGERTMAGLAFLFALSHAPADRQDAGLPLAVLDEVDAPLDEANIRRFTRFLTLFAERGSQFLLVTHQKATMEVASAIWGVTTDASGASRVLSIRQADDERVGARS